MQITYIVYILTCNNNNGNNFAVVMLTLHTINHTNPNMLEEPTMHHILRHILHHTYRIALIHNPYSITA